MLPNQIRITICFILITLAFHQAAFASSIGNLRVGGLTGYGGASATANNVTRVQEPMGLNLFIDYSFSPRFTLGAEHVRIFKGVSSAVGFTGVVGKYYFWTPQPQYMDNPDDAIEKNQVIQKNITPYVGGSFGFAQSSISARANTENPILSTSLYFSGKGGLEYPITGRWGARAELGANASVGGDEQILSIQALIGIYYFL